MGEKFLKKENRTELYKKTIKMWGEKSQMEMAQEEATELALAVRKFSRTPSDKTFFGLIDEIADVEIMIEQMKFMLTSVEVGVNQRKLGKLLRLEKRLSEHRFD